MTSLQIVVVVAVAVGSLFIFAALLLHMRAVRRIPETLHAKWRVVAVLMAFFLVGYLVFLVIYLRQQGFPLEMLTAVVFFGGGLFVFLVTGITLRTLQQVVAHERQLHIINEALQRSNHELVFGL